MVSASSIAKKQRAKSRAKSSSSKSTSIKSSSSKSSSSSSSSSTSAIDKAFREAQKKRESIGRPLTTSEVKEVSKKATIKSSPRFSTDATPVSGTPIASVVSKTSGEAGQLLTSGNVQLPSGDIVSRREFDASASFGRQDTSTPSIGGGRSDKKSRGKTSTTPRGIASTEQGVLTDTGEIIPMSPLISTQTSSQGFKSSKTSKTKQRTSPSIGTDIQDIMGQAQTKPITQEQLIRQRENEIKNRINNDNLNQFQKLELRRQVAQLKKQRENLSRVEANKIVIPATATVLPSGQIQVSGAGLTQSEIQAIQRSVQQSGFDFPDAPASFDPTNVSLDGLTGQPSQPIELQVDVTRGISEDFLRQLGREEQQRTGAFEQEFAFQTTGGRGVIDVIRASRPVQAFEEFRISQLESTPEAGSLEGSIAFQERIKEAGGRKEFQQSIKQRELGELKLGILEGKSPTDIILEQKTDILQSPAVQAPLFFLGGEVIGGATVLGGKAITATATRLGASSRVASTISTGTLITGGAILTGAEAIRINKEISKADPADKATILASEGIAFASIIKGASTVIRTSSIKGKSGSEKSSPSISIKVDNTRPLVTFVGKRTVNTGTIRDGIIKIPIELPSTGKADVYGRVVTTKLKTGKELTVVKIESQMVRDPITGRMQLIDKQTIGLKNTRIGKPKIEKKTIPEQTIVEDALTGQAIRSSPALQVTTTKQLREARRGSINDKIKQSQESQEALLENVLQTQEGDLSRFALQQDIFNLRASPQVKPILPQPAPKRTIKAGGVSEKELTIFGAEILRPSAEPIPRAESFGRLLGIEIDLGVSTTKIPTTIRGARKKLSKVEKKATKTKPIETTQNILDSAKPSVDILGSGKPSGRGGLAVKPKSPKAPTKINTKNPIGNELELFNNRLTGRTVTKSKSKIRTGIKTKQPKTQTLIPTLNAPLINNLFNPPITTQTPKQTTTTTTTTKPRTRTPQPPRTGIDIIDTPQPPILPDIPGLPAGGLPLLFPLGDIGLPSGVRGKRSKVKSKKNPIATVEELLGL